MMSNSDRKTWYPTIVFFLFCLLLGKAVQRYHVEAWGLLLQG